MWGHCSAAPRRRTGCSHWIGTAVPPTARGEVVHHDRSCAVSGVEDRRLATLAWCADAGCLDPPTPAVVANGPARPSSPQLSSRRWWRPVRCRRSTAPRWTATRRTRCCSPRWRRRRRRPRSRLPDAAAGARAAGRGHCGRCARHRPRIQPVQELRPLGRLRRQTRNHPRLVRHGTTASCDAPPPVTWPGYSHLLRTNA